MGNKEESNKWFNVFELLIEYAYNSAINKQTFYQILKENITKLKIQNNENKKD